jgi:lipopolysaccharide export system permease protein
MKRFLFERYLLRAFAFTFLFALLTLLVVFQIINVIQDLDNFIDNDVPVLVVVEYYGAMVPELVELLAPVAMLMGALFAIGRMSTSNEITAMRSAGFSMLQIMTPLLVFAVLISIAHVAMSDRLVPAAKQQKNDIARKWLKEGAKGESLYNLHFRDTPVRNVGIQYYDPATHQGRTVSVEEFSSDTTPRIVRRIDAATMVWDTVHVRWVMPEAVVRTFRRDTIDMVRIDSMAAPFSITHEQLVSLQQDLSELTFEQKQAYIQTLARGGKNTRSLEIGRASDIAYPFASVIVVLLAVPFASIKRRGGIASNIALGLLVALTYLAFTMVVRAVGVTMDIPVLAVAWSSNALFLLVSFGILVARRV